MKASLTQINSDIEYRARQARHYLVLARWRMLKMHSSYGALAARVGEIDLAYLRSEAQFGENVIFEQTFKRASRIGSSFPFQNSKAV